MRTFMLTFLWVLSTTLVSSAWAQNAPANDENRPQRGPEFRQKMLENFDADGDGTLSDEERQTARETMRQRRGGRQGQQGLGPGRGGQPDPNEVFDLFDADGDGMLSREEFLELAKAHRQRMGRGGGQGRGQGPAEGRGPRRGPPGPPRGDFDRPGPPAGPPAPPEGREFRGRPPLRNPIDGPPLPPEEGAFDRGPRRGLGGGRGPGFGQGGPGGRAVPDPNRVFDRFDVDGDDYLSREEFAQLADTMRDLRQRWGQGQGQGRGRGQGQGRGGFGPGRGGPGRGGPGSGPRGGPPLDLETEVPAGGETDSQ